MTARRLYWLAAGLSLLAVLSLAVDVPIAAYCRQLQDPLYDSGGIVKSLKKVVLLAEVFAHGFGAAAILLTAFVLAPGHRRRLLRSAVLVGGAGLLANLVKVLVGRWRPNHRVVETVWESFAGWLPGWVYQPAETIRAHELQSFPSGHSVTAVTMAIALTALYPRGRSLFAVFAGMAILQRWLVLAHYPSDTLAGAALAAFFAVLLFDGRLAGRWFDQFERL